ncbi:MAG: LysE family translocator [Acidisphaera sp.]|nr:LysE family translocator [Acidisphaera sp.]
MMSIDLMLAFTGFAFVTSITPGPNNTMLLASGVNFGFRRTLPHITGITFGCLFMVVMVGLGLGSLFTAYPLLYTVLRYVGAAYMLVLAWHIARAGPPGTGGGMRRPMRFIEAVAFQWVNPKAWVIVLGAVTTYTPRDDFFRNVVLVALAFAVVNAPSVAIWAGFGVALRRWLNRPGRIRIFNVTMALLLVLSLYPLVESSGG